MAGNAEKKESLPRPPRKTESGLLWVRNMALLFGVGAAAIGILPLAAVSFGGAAVTHVAYDSFRQARTAPSTPEEKKK